jgi:hypothetical protein
MQILKGKKDRQPDINQYADMKNSHVQEIKLEDWVNQAKANREAYEAGKESLEVILERIRVYNEEQTEQFCSDFPPELVRYAFPYMVLLEGDRVIWNKEAVKILISNKNKNDVGYRDWNLFYRFVAIELMEYLGIDSEKRDDLMIKNGWIFSDLVDYALSTFKTNNEKDENN